MGGKGKRTPSRATQPSSRHGTGSRWPLRLLALAAAMALVAAAAFWFGRFPGGGAAGHPPALGTPGPFELENERAVFARYGGSQSCRECHEEAFDEWKGSHHALAERKVQPELDRPAFVPPRSLQRGAETLRLNWTGEQPQATEQFGALTNLASPQTASAGLSNSQTFPLARVIGEDPLRQFLVPFPGGRFQTLEASYHPRSNEWFNVFGAEERRPGEWGHWTGRGMNWNYMCANCHNTRLRRNYDEPTDAYRTTMAEMSVGCEACHGPLQAHNDWQRLNGKSRQKDPTLTKPSRQQVVDTCGVCHARRTELTGDYKPGESFLDHCALSMVDRSDIYYPDGQVREEDYEYASFLSSRMHFRGVYCLDCHKPHSGKTLLPGNWLCMRCHNGTYTNAPQIAPVAHSHHKVYGYGTNGEPNNFDLNAYHPESIKETGGECVNCHMPQTVYMQRHWRHDHGFTIPDPLLTKQFGIPNACNRCHKDKDPQWALNATEQWYGARMDRPTRARAQWLARARAGDPEARPALLRLLAQEEVPYWGAAAADMLEPWAAEPAVAQGLLNALAHTNALVRGNAARTLETSLAAAIPGTEAALKRALADPSRNVRLAAAWALRSTLDLASAPGRELLQFLEVSADQPSGQMQKGAFYFSRHDLPRAREHFQKAVAWDPYSSPFREQLAIVLSAEGRPKGALDTLKEGIRLMPQDAELHFQLGLAWNEMGNLPQAAAELKQAAELNPRLGSAWYNLGLAQNALHDPETALESLQRAESVSPLDARIPYARATLLAQLGRSSEALAATRQALKLQPDFPEAKALLTTLAQPGP